MQRVEGEGEGEGEEEGETAVALRAPPPPPSTERVPRKRGKRDLPEEMLPTYHGAKAAFEASQKAQALMYQDRDSTARELKALKLLVERAHKIAPEAPAPFLAAAMTRYRELCNTQLRGKAYWTPAGLATSWIWSLVLEGMQTAPTPEEVELSQVVSGIFARRAS